jgi:hypothetical protein
MEHPTCEALTMDPDQRVTLATSAACWGLMLGW